MLCRPVEFWCKDNVHDIVVTCFILHNMMVEVRLEREQQESEDWHNILNEDSDSDNEESNNTQDKFVGRHEIDLDDEDLRAKQPSLRERMKIIRERWPCHNDERSTAIKAALDEHFDNSQRDWRDLHNGAEHMRLRQALVNGLDSGSANKQASY